MLLTLTHNVKTLAPLAGYLFPASHQHLQSQLSCTANLLCCANTKFCQVDTFCIKTVWEKVGSAGNGHLTPSTPSGGVMLPCCLSTVFVSSEVAGVWERRAVLPVSFYLPESQTVLSFSLMRKILWLLITNEVNSSFPLHFRHSFPPPRCQINLETNLFSNCSLLRRCCGYSTHCQAFAAAFHTRNCFSLNSALSLALSILNWCKKSTVFTFRMSKVAFSAVPPALSCAMEGQHLQKHWGIYREDWTRP